MIRQYLCCEGCTKVAYQEHADHAAVGFMLKPAKPQSSAEKRVVYDFKTADFEQFRDLLSAFPWDIAMFVRREHQRFVAKIQGPFIRSSR